MATMEPVANRQSSADSLVEWASEVWGMEEGEMDPTLAQDTTPPPHPLVKQAPRAMSEALGSESPDAAKPRPQVSPSSENLTDSTNKMAEVVPKMEQEALSGINQVPSNRIQVGDSELERDLKMIDNTHCEKEEDAVAFRSPLACTGQASPAECAPETQPYPLEEEEEEEETIDCISDGKVEVISNPVEEEMSSSDSQGSQEWPSRSHLDDVVEEDKEEEYGAKEDKVEEFQSVEMMENGSVRLQLNTERPARSEFEQGLSETVCTTEKASVEGGPVETSSSPLSVQVADKQEVSECPISSDREKTLSDNNNHDTMKAAETSTTSHSPLKRERSDDIFSESPENPESALAGDGEENQSVDSKPLDISSARRQWVRLDSTRGKLPQPEQSTSSRSSSCSHLLDLAQPPGVVTPDKQQGELLRNVTAALTHHSNQEVAAQQVFKGATLAPPLATVAKEPANQVKADLLGSGCVVVKEQAGGERKVGKREGDNRQTGGERGQRASGLGAAGEADRKKKEKRSEKKKTNPGLLMSRDSHSKASKMKLGGDLFDDSQSDSGVSADFSPGSTVELQTTTPTPTLTSPPADETPIEREIRRAVQREQSLRRSRGLHNNPPTQEYVDIPLRKSVLTETLPSKSDKSQGGKDRLFAGKKMQKEISVETQREQVLVRLGKVRGSYDKGTVRQLKERKKLFEAFQEPKETSSMILSQIKAPSWASASDLSTLEIQGNDASSVSFVGGSFGERRRSSLELTQNQSPSGTPKGITYTPPGAPVPRGPTLSESAGGPIIILDNHHHLVLPAPAHVHHVSKPLRHSHSTGTLTETQGLTVVDSASIYSSTSALSGEERRVFWRDEDGGRMDQEEEEEVPKENPFFKLRSSSVSQDKVEQDIREAREREKELRRQRSSLYGGGGGGGGGGGRPASREVQSPTSPPPPLLLQNGLVTPELSVTPSSRSASATPTARQSLGKLGMWPPPQTDEYPDSQSEGLQSPRTPRQKTPLLQRWESGQVMNGHGGEED
ncbi:uncharacterized protein LOC112238537 [Oncorhynchus tshawytscha]|uniref:uncharacterized protein LOC112238537 n=1 Tax=Oncorhynchus tshawytscha TaxID=74940 RepID=UPI001C3DA04C|nr:uncharacterized protein LOC112238537 [Oncorhynchus tshawytscha]